MNSITLAVDSAPLDSGSSATVEMLTPVWERVLHRSAVRADQNFFDLGGDAVSAVELFRAIARLIGKALPAFTICQAPTIEALASLIDQQTPPRFPSRVLLKSGDKWPPVFMLHGIGGSIMELCRLARHTRCENPIYGMQMRGINAGEEPFQELEEMARFHLDVIEKLQPTGPYVLIGYSLGGLVMLEAARRLCEKGESVRMLAMVDSYPHPRFLPAGERLRLAVRLAGRRAFRLAHRARENGFGFNARSTLKLQIPSSTKSRKKSGAQVDSAYFPSIGDVRRRAYMALKNYRPGFYHGNINFVRAQTASWFPENAAAVWGRLANQIQIDTVPGDHLEMLTTECASLAGVLSRYIGESVC